jgi:hypothetical protein
MDPVELNQKLLLLNPWLPAWIYREHRHISRGCGYYARGVVNVAPSQCAHPGRGYSWPGAACDRTVLGVYYHEVGHHVHANLHHEQQFLSTLWHLKRPAVSSYEPNPGESFAETFRIFCTNPTLLMLGRPRRWDLFTRSGIVPPKEIKSSWEYDLASGAPQRYLDMCERWLKRT